MTEYKHANPESLDRVSCLLNELEKLYDELDNCSVQASKAKALMMDRTDRRFMAEVEHLIERAMDILESLK